MEKLHHQISPDLSLVELPVRECSENRFEHRFFTLPETSTIADALEAIGRRYNAPGGDTTSFSYVKALLADIPEIARVLELEKYPNVGAAKAALQKAAKEFTRELTEGERQSVNSAVENHDRHMTAAFTALERWVAASGENALGAALEDWTLGKNEIWGRLSHPLLGVEVVVTSRSFGSVWSRKKEVSGMYYHDVASGSSIGFAVDSTKRLLPPFPFEWAGKTRLRAEGQQLDFYTPRFYEGDIPNTGILRPSHPSIESGTAISLGHANCH